MVPDDDDWRRKRRREEEAEEEAIAEARRRLAKGELSSVGGENANFLPLDDLMHQAEGLIEQVNALYQQYTTGVEARPPRERRQLLERIIAQLSQAPKAVQMQKFRFSNIQSKYLLHRDRWDRLEKDVESGKIKRSVGPKR